jgi:hypothetical protein
LNSPKHSGIQINILSILTHGLYKAGSVHVDKRLRQWVDDLLQERQLIISISEIIKPCVVVDDAFNLHHRLLQIVIFENI